MKSVTLTIIAALLLVGSASQAMLLDSMDDIFATGWVETRGTALMQQSGFSRDGSGGSMRIAYDQTDTVWDIVPQRYFHAANPPVSPPPHHNQLDMTNPETNTITFWMYTDENAAKARVHQIILFSYATSTPARFTVPIFDTPGWNKVVAPVSEFVVDNNDPAFLWSGIQTFQFWCTTWDTRGTSAIYIDDLRLVPEPTTLIVLGLGSLVVFRRRKVV